MQKDHNDIKELDIYFPISEYDELLGVSINGDSVVFTEIRWVHFKSSLNGSYIVRKHLNVRTLKHCTRKREGLVAMSLLLQLSDEIIY